MNQRCVLIHVQGIVQGVGFRPYVFQLAHRHGLGGWVRNQPNGVEIEIAGPADRIESFLADLPAGAPPLSRIFEIKITEQPFQPFDRFHITTSHADASRSTLIAPDVCPCDDCLRELFDPKNRRYRYPFINCTNCGPRYTIIKDIPYDRDKTTMTPFTMCPSCRREYEDPMDRRFHAQPNACWDCGPMFRLVGAEGQLIAEGEAAIGAALNSLTTGAIVAVKGLGGFHLAVRADREEAVQRLRGRKIREEKPFAVMFADLDTARLHCRVSAEEAALLQARERPIVLLERQACAQGSAIAPSVAPRNRFLGAFLPYTPLHYLLFEGSACKALVMTSGNQSDEPIVIDNETALERLRGIADVFLLHDRDIHMRCDDSVTRVLHRKPRPLRRARGYVPAPVVLRESLPSVLGVGAELKNTLCLIRGSEAFLSQHIGDLENLETLHAFEQLMDHLQRILDIEPECIVHDLHPDYLSTQWALRQKEKPCLAVQHHHAHVASVMAEHGLLGPVLGLVLDGSGYGTDGTIWGGEFLLADERGFKRLGHFRQVPLPGGAKAIQEPWRMALSYLWGLSGGRVETDFEDILVRWPQSKRRVVLQMLDRRINAPLTSSCGRLFDAVSALVGLRETVTYEGQAAIELEQAILPDEGVYEGTLRQEQGMWILDPLPMVEEVVREVRRDCPGGIIAARFHNGLVRLLAEMMDRLREETALDRVALSGGVFQNAYLLERLEAELQQRGFEVYSHELVPSNDACIALGQAYIGAYRLL